MSVRQAWRQLGLDPCRDERAVKRAYAARLKAIDPDRDPEAFARLRMALEMARADARRRAMSGVQIVDDLSDPAEGEIAATESEDEIVDEAMPEPDPAKPFVDAIIDNLFPQEGDRTDPAALIAAVEGLLGDPRMEQFDFATDTEEWLALHALRSIPHSDPVMVMLADHFKWERQLDRAQPNQLLLAAAQRANDLRCIQALSDPGHRWHEAWLALSDPGLAKPALADRVRLNPAVSELMASLSYNNPNVLGQCTPVTVQRWSEFVKSGVSADIVPANGISWFGWLVMGWLVLSLLSGLVAGAGQ